MKPHHSVLTTGITTLLHFLISLSFFFLFSFSLFAQGQQSIEVTSYANVIDNDDGTDGGGIVSSGDKIEYKVNVTNLSDAPISSLTLSSFFQGADNSSISLTEALTFSSSNAGSSEGTLSVGETATYVASYTFDAAGVSAGGVEFYATA
ncbi:MAG: hypothetical protein ACPGCJ_03740, partial [Flavobacteriaceae bacterium]